MRLLVFFLDDLLTRLREPLFAVGDERGPDERNLKQLFVTMRHARRTPELARLTAFLGTLRENGYTLILFTDCDPRIVYDMITGFLQEFEIPYDLYLHGDDPSDFCRRVAVPYASLRDAGAGKLVPTLFDFSEEGCRAARFASYEEAAACLTN